MNSNPIHFFEVEPWEKEAIETHFPSNNFIIWEGHIQDVNIAEIQDCGILCSFVFSEISEALLNQLPHLKMIATRSTGVDHIDLVACKKRNIHVANVPLYGERTVAEHTFALILALSRKIIPSIERTRSGSFSLEGLRGFDLYEKTIGIIGTGNIGKNVAQIAKSFGMKIIAYDIQPDPELTRKWDVEYVSFGELLKKSNVISLHVPYHQSTHHLIRREHLPLIQKGTLLINTSRGGVIETEALIEGLSQAIFGGLGLDVLENEAKIREERELISTLFTGDLKSVTTLLANEYLLRHHDNVIVTPHNAFNTEEALKRILITSLENIKDFQNGKLSHAVI